ncbi:hypothetical protein LIER_44001 [Lithospermum erythrorhizon]|uniref:Reverse transcriptase n=1 Tax=Lithospermum erythrorhizon TaxID=34254 RepID=A0AAV3RGK6_LITER
MVEWSSLWYAMQFRQRFIGLLKACVGDAISSYLFILVLEVFNGLMRKAVRLNCDKSTIYFGSTPSAMKQELCLLMGMKEGLLSMKYLRVPLFGRKLTKEHYSILIGKVCGKIDSWQSRQLSMGGRAQLIRSSIFGVQNFWCSLFPLPKYVIYEVEKRIRAFLWKSTSERSYHAKMATICFPFAEGSFEFKDMFEWNRVCLGMLLLLEINED